MEYITWTTDQFQQHDMLCPYLQNDRCSIYPVRPIVCRLQGNIADLPCFFPQKQILSTQRSEQIKKDFNQLLKDMNSIGIFYGTRKIG